MTKYRKKPVEIEAVKWTGENHKEVFDFVGVPYDGTETYGNGINIHTEEGTMRAFEGDYIIKGIQGELYPCKPDIFEQTYERV